MDMVGKAFITGYARDVGELASLRYIITDIILALPNFRLLSMDLLIKMETSGPITYRPMADLAIATLIPTCRGT
jgi:hypothetical protein